MAEGGGCPLDVPLLAGMHTASISVVPSWREPRLLGGCRARGRSCCVPVRHCMKRSRWRPVTP